MSDIKRIDGVKREVHTNKALTGAEEITAVQGTIVVSSKGTADRKPGAMIWNQVQQMDGEKVAREWPAEHQLITDGWGHDLFFPSLVYLPEKDRLLLLCTSRGRQDYTNSFPVLLSSDDHGKTWSNATRDLKNPQGTPYQAAGGLGLAYFGHGQLTMDVGDEFDQLRLFSHDFGETWTSRPIPKASSGFFWYRWDPCAADTDPATGEVTRLIDTGYSSGMGRQFDQGKRLVVFPEQWHWRHDPKDRGSAEEWYREKSFDHWPRMMRIDKQWTRQGEPLGVGWYATHFETPDTGGLPLLLLFGAVDGYCDVFVDGKKVGEQKQPLDVMWDRPFHLSLDKGLPPGRHTMVIRVSKENGEAGVHKPVWLVEKPVSDTSHFASAPNFYAHIRFSYDGGRTWPEEITPPSWNGTGEGVANEVALCRAANNDLIAACRFRNRKLPSDRYSIDHYCGLAVSLSKDNGYTWSEMKVLHEYGRMHPSMALLPNGDIVMTYAVRRGLLEKEHRLVDEDGYPQWGVEAIVSRDHGASWDLSHKYVLAKWSGMNQSQATSTVLLPDGSLLTAFGSGYLSQPVEKARRQGESNVLPPHEVCLVRWRPSSS